MENFDFSVLADPVGKAQVACFGRLLHCRRFGWRRASFARPNVRAKEALINQVDCDDLPE